MKKSINLISLYRFCSSTGFYAKFSRKLNKGLVFYTTDCRIKVKLNSFKERNV